MILYTHIIQVVYIYTLPDQLGTGSCLSTGGPTKSEHNSPDLKTLGMLSQQGTSGDVPEVNSDNKKLPSQTKQQRIIPELGGGFKYFLGSSHYLGKLSRLTIFFSNGLKPPTSEVSSPTK